MTMTTKPTTITRSARATTAASVPTTRNGATSRPAPTSVAPGAGAFDWVAVPSPIGEVIVEGDDAAVVRVWLPSRSVAERFAGTTSAPAPRAVALAAAQLEDYFAGRRRSFDVPLAFAGGTPFQQAVWTTLADIPFGATWSYAELAAAVGRPVAFRAVGQANGANPIPIILPCHRVVASGRRLGGYGGGLDMKRSLLALEGVRDLRP